MVGFCLSPVAMELQSKQTAQAAMLPVGAGIDRPRADGKCKTNKASRPANS